MQSLGGRVMQKNKNIISALTKWRKLLFGLVCSQFAFFAAVNLFLSRFLSGFEIEKNSLMTVRIIVSAVLICFYIIIDGNLLKRIKRTKTLIDVTPIECVVEDILLIRSKRKNQIRYNAYFLLKSVATNQLLFTYGDYSLSYYNYSVSQMNKTLNSVIVFRKDGSQVKIGDIAYAYIKQFVGVDVRIDGEKLKLNRKKIYLRNINKNYDINIFNNAKFFEGAVEIEDIDL